jgi:membrane fusion protein, multidrug efflux system
MRFLVVALGLLFVVGALAATKATQIGTLVAFGKRAEQMGPPPESVGAATAEQQLWEQSLSAVGTVAASKGVILSNEEPGVVTKISFESGQRVRQGQVLVELNTRVESAELTSAIATLEHARRREARTTKLYEGGAAARVELEAAQSELAVASAQVDSLRARIARRNVRAPFSGRVGICDINLGQYLNPGTPITSLEAADEVFVDFTLPQERLDELAVDMPVRIVVDDNLELMSAVAAIEPTVDEVTRAARLRAAVPNEDGRLRPGMFVDVEVVLPEREPVVVVPATAVVHAAYGDSIYVVAEKPGKEPGLRQTPDGKPVKVARQRFVRVGEQRGDFIAVVEGLAPGEQIVTAGGFKLKNGAPIVLTDKAVPRPQLAPEPQDR